MKNVMVLVDESGLTPKAVAEAVKNVDKDHDKLYLLNVSSSWDVLSDEKSAGRLVLSQQQAYCEAERCSVIAEQIEASNIGEAVVKSISKYKISEVYVGADAFTKCANDSNLLFWAFSSLSGVLRGPIVDYVVRNAPSSCRVNVVGRGVSLP